MTPLIHRTPAWVWYAVVVTGVVGFIVTMVAAFATGVHLHADNVKQTAELETAKTAIGQLAATNARQDAALDQANRRLRRMGAQPVGEGPAGPRGEPAFPFTFTIPILDTTYTVTCFSHLRCTTKEVP
jgi:hypothetical protein